MAGPWEKYQAAPASSATVDQPASSGPWSKYQPSATTPDPQVSTAPAQPATPPEVGTGEAFARGAGDGITFGLQDEIIAGLDAAVQPLIPTGNGAAGETFGQRYDANVANQRALLKAGQDQHPIASIAGGLIGGIVPAISTGGTAPAATLAGNIGKGALVGAGYGGAYGFGSAEGDIADRLPEAVSGAALGGALGGAFPAVAAGTGKLLRSSADRAEAVAAQQQVSAQAARESQDVVNAATGATDVPSNKSGIVQSVADAAQASPRTQAEKFANLAEQAAPDPKILDAAAHLDMMGDVLPGQVSNSQPFRELNGAIASIIGSAANEKQAMSYQKLAQKADDLVTQSGGSLDKSAFSDKFRVESQNTINGLNSQAEDLYKHVHDAIPNQTQAPADATISYIQSRAADFGGAPLLSADESKALRILSPKVETIPNPLVPGTVQTVTTHPTYSALDAVRKDVGDGYKGRGPFASSSSRTLDALYANLSKDQQAVAEAAGVGDAFTAAKSVVAQRKGLEDNLIQAIGKDMTGAITSSFGGAVKNLESGNFKNYDKLIKLIPPHLREEAVLTSLNDAFTARSGTQKQLNVPGFVDWFTGISRNEAAKQRLTQYLRPETVKTLDAIATLGGGMRRLSAERISTGKLGTLPMLQELTEQGGLVSKVWDIGKQVSVAEGATSALGFPGAGTASVMTKILVKDKTPITKAAEDLFLNPKFHDAILAAAETGGSQPGRLKAREAQLMRTSAYKRWFAAIGENSKAQVRAAGPLAYFTTDAKPTEAAIELPPTVVNP